MVCSLSRSLMYKRRGATWARDDRHTRAAPRPKDGMQRRGNSVRFDRNDGKHPIYRDGSRADCFSNPRRGGGAGEIDGAERRERICDGVGDGGEDGDGAGFAEPLTPSGLVVQRVPMKPRSREGRSSARGIA